MPKLPIAEGLLTPLSIEGDSCAHPEIHGGPKQAILIICSEVIDELRALGFPVFPGALGENITTVGIDRRQFRIGQRFRIGSAVVELSKARGPCETLSVYNSDGSRIQQAIYDKGVKAGDYASPYWGMSGMYARVIETGSIRPGDPIRLVELTA